MRPARSPDEAATQHRAGERVLGAWTLEGLLGLGALSEVWLARDVRGAPAAVKILRPRSARWDPAARLRREARVLSLLRHEAVPALLAEGATDDGHPALVMSYIEGRDLAARLGDGARLDVGDVVAVVRRASEVLGAAHRLGVVHRDVKPGNVMLHRDALAPEAVRVIDFGVALAANDPRITDEGTTLGTPWYLAPEQCLGLPATPAVDVYGLGATMFHLLTGRPLFPEARGRAQVTAHVHEAPPRVRALRPEVSPDLDVLVAAMVSKDPASRPPTGDVVARALAGLRDAQPNTAVRATRAVDAASLRDDIARVSRELADAELEVTRAAELLRLRAQVCADAAQRGSLLARADGHDAALEALRAQARARLDALRAALADTSE